MRRAAVAGALGTIAESALMQVGMKIGGGRRPVFLPSAMVSRMAGQIGYTLDDSVARLVGDVMRAGDGPAWGVGGHYCAVSARCAHCAIRVCSDRSSGPSNC